MGIPLDLLAMLGGEIGLTRRLMDKLNSEYNAFAKRDGKGGSTFLANLKVRRVWILKKGGGACLAFKGVHPSLSHLSSRCANTNCNPPLFQ